MLRFSVLLLTVYSLLGSTSLYAQDLLGSTAATTRSYSYVEVQYLPDLDADLPLLATVVVDITDSISFVGEYLRQETTFSTSFGDLELDGQALSVGFLYHQPLAAMPDSDWVAGLRLGRIEVEGRASNGAFSAEASDSFQEGYLGIRRSMTETIEAEAGLNLFITDGDTEISGDLRMIIRIRQPWDIALAINEIGEGDLFGIGLRYTW